MKAGGLFRCFNTFIEMNLGDSLLAFLFLLCFLLKRFRCTMISKGIYIMKLEVMLFRILLDLECFRCPTILQNATVAAFACAFGNISFSHCFFLSFPPTYYT
ncbi:hypothetical protein BD289DRAFT_175289 [Coniella lustricola]|uniref:Uncharacterized protein n=1 Tax=Coniella lustricola TaxID=2025994 RepID=A0A2T3ADV0_9PEZI|nr:hypothetical protein BD289DRAFT_175289 [Coniella lustricola]